MRAQQRILFSFPVADVLDVWPFGELRLGASAKGIAISRHVSEALKRQASPKRAKEQLQVKTAGYFESWKDTTIVTRLRVNHVAGACLPRSEVQSQYRTLETEYCALALRLRPHSRKYAGLAPREHPRRRFHRRC